MTTATQIARYLLFLDENGNIFNDNTITMNGRTSNEGNIRLNKYLHIMQMVYIAKYGKLLFDDELLAFDNGAIVDKVRLNYSYFSKNRIKVEIDDKETKHFIDRMFDILKNAPLDELVDISHQDKEWQNKHSFYYKKDQIMNIENQFNNYQKQYADFLKVLGND